MRRRCPRCGQPIKEANLGVMPLVLILAVVSNKALAKRTTSWERPHTAAIRHVSGAAMIVVGLLTVVLA